MNSAHAFAFATSGSFTDSQMQQNAAYVNKNIAEAQSAGGWLANQATKIMDGFTNFLNSRAWEFSKRFGADENGEYVGRFEIGYLGTADAIMNAQGLMPNYIMANPRHMQAHLDGKIMGYENLHALCTGVGASNAYYRKAMDGVLNVQTVDGKNKADHTHYIDSGSNRLGFRDLVNIQKTWSAADYHRAKGMFDIKSEEEPVVE